MIVFRISVLLLLSFCISSLKAQSNFTLTINNRDAQAINFKYQTQFLDTFSRSKEEVKLLASYSSLGYIFANYHNSIDDGKNKKMDLNLGERFIWGNISYSSKCKEILAATNYKDRQLEGKYIDPNKMVSIIETMLKYCENNGYPFAKIQLDSIVIIENKVNATLMLALNQLIKIDSVRILSEPIISKQFICSYIGIKENSLYNESLVKDINLRISELAFLKTKLPTQILFTQTATIISIYPEKKNANQFDGIIGVLPANTATPKTQIIGQLHLALLNTFKRGESIDIAFHGQPNSTRDLKVKALYPFLLGSPFSIDYQFYVRRQDTTFSQLNQEIGLPYFRRAGNYFKVYFKSFQTNLLSTKGLEFATVLPSYADISTNQYGIGIREEHLDYRYNPRKGYSLILSTSGGNRIIKKNASVNEAVYDSLQLKSTQLRLEGKFEYFLGIYARNVIRFSVLGALIKSPELFRNELLRFGGINDLRGFDEESIFASEFVIYTLEYRFLLDQNSFFQLFYNQAYYSSNVSGSSISDNPYGFGAGINFETKAGIFSLSYALGKQFNNPIDFSAAKIHFGIINYF